MTIPMRQSDLPRIHKKFQKYKNEQSIISCRISVK